MDRLYQLLFGHLNTAQKGLVVLAVIAFIVLLLSDANKARTAFSASTNTMVGLVVLIFAGILLGSILQVTVPRPVIESYLGEKAGFWAIPLAVVVGAFTPGGPFVVFPLSATLLAIGARLDVVMAYITAWTAIALTRATVEMAFLTPRVVAIRILVGLPLPFIAAWLTRFLAGWIR
ncbi:MAG: hypothetical protein ACE5NP_05595 [Anaerolineae bacterium]